MRIGKQKNTEPSSEEKLEQKVDAMMDPRVEDAAKPAADDEPTEKGAEPEIDIFSDPTTAPEVPKDLAKKMSLKTPKEPTIAEAAAAAEAPKEAAAEDTPAPEALPTEATVGDLTDQLEDARTDEAVDDILKKEADTVLAADDEAKQPKEPVREHRSFGQKIKTFFRAWWANKWARWATIIAVIALFIGAAMWPGSRYFVLNNAGVRSSASMKVVDDATGLPLKNVAVNLGTTQAKSDEEGKVRFARVRLGTQTLEIDRVAFAPVKKQVTIGWGSNPLPDVSLRATGAQYTFTVTDYLSGKPLQKAEATSGGASAFADKNGKIILTVDDPQTATLNVTIKVDEYRTEKLAVPVTTKTVQPLQMVPDQPVVYVSKQSGKYDLYKVDVDGKNKKLILAGSGHERSSMRLAVSPDGSQAALVSSRGTQRDRDGYLLDTLTLVDLKNGETKTLDSAQRLQLIDWIGPRLIYTATYAAASAATGNRERIISYNTQESARLVVTQSDYFNGVLTHEGFIYYIVANSDPKQQPGFMRIKVDGSGHQTLLNKQVWTLQQISTTQASMETPDGWYDYTFGDTSAKKGTAPADAYVNHNYFPNVAGTKSLWAEVRDGKGVLLLHDDKANKDTTIVNASGVSEPLRWLSANAVEYRVNNASEIAEYVKNLDGGNAKKVSDVTPTSGFGFSQ